MTSYYDNNDPRDFRSMNDQRAGYAPTTAMPQLQEFPEPMFRAPKYTIDNNAQMPYGRHAVTQARISTLAPAKQPKNWRMIIIAIFSVVIVGIGPFAIVASYAHKTDNSSVTVVQQPKSAGQVADQIGCTDFVEADPGSSGMVVTDGTCVKGGVKYAIDTFASQTVRDEWIQKAEVFGVVPKWETATSVTYKSTEK